MPSDQFDFVRARDTSCRPISPGLDQIHCRQLILKLTEVISRNCLNARVSCSKVFMRAGNNPVALKNSTEHAEPLFIALFDTLCLKIEQNLTQL